MSWVKTYVEQYLGEHTIANADFAVLMESVLTQGKPFRFRSAGFSMSPFIRDGDVLTLVHPSQQHLHQGTVIAFIQPVSGMLAVHRVVAQRDGVYLVKGDNSRKPDGWVPQSDILGVVTRVERNGKPIHLGGGWECGLVACLSKYNILKFSVGLIYAVYRRLFKGKKHEQSR